MVTIRHVSCVLLGFILYYESEGAETCKTEACQKAANRILEYMDPTVPPCQDFYRFACGRFVDTAVIPDDKTQNSSFSQVDDSLDDQLRHIVLQPPRPDEPQPYRNMKHLFSLCMDEKKIDARGLSHAVSLLEAAGGWPVLGNWDIKGWSFMDTEIRLRNHSIGGGSLFRFSVSTDAKNGKQRVIEIDQAGLGLTREFLVKGEDDPIVKAYYSYMVDIAVMFGAPRQTATEQLLESLRFEIELAKITTPREERREYDRMYNPYLLPDLMKELGWIDWKRLLSSIMPKSVPLMEKELIIVNEVGFLKRLQNFLQKYPTKVLANYMMWRAANGLSGILTTEMRDRHLEYSKVVIGTKSRAPRWKECVGVASSLDLALSSLYVKEFFDETSKKEALDMTEQIRQEIVRDIKEIDWMDDKTRKRAEFKASKVVQHIGYPDELVNITKLEDFYKDLSITTEHYFESLLHLSRWANDYSFRQLREPVNKTDWRTHGSVAIVNAFYNPMENSMQFPAGILQQPFFSSQVPRYINYATIGFIVAHEITHGFDDQGSQFDADGELKEWWEMESKKRFVEKKKCMIDQYSSYRDNDTQLNLNGVNTQGENVADNGGMKLALRAYHRLAAQLTTPEPLLPGLEKYSREQLFLLSFANMWCTRYRPEALKVQITAGVHSPVEFRVNGVLKNNPAFTKAFQCTDEDAMNPKLKCAVW